MRDAELAIVGAGVAGLTAALVAARRGLDVLVIERLGAGGQVMNVARIDDFPGFPEGLSGIELGPRLQEQAEAAGARFTLDRVEALTRHPDGRHLLRCEEEDVVTRAVVIATGSSRRRLGIPGEERLAGRGVSECAGCDGPLFRERTVCVIGGGDSAFGEAHELASHAKRVFVIFRAARPHAQHALVEALRLRANVELVTNAEAIAITGEAGVEAVVLRTADAEAHELKVDGIFVYAGLRPESAFVAQALTLDGAGRIITDAAMQASVPGIFVAGDVRAGSPSTLATAAGEGALAALSAHTWLHSIDKIR